jgi:hypothetical protein
MHNRLASQYPVGLTVLGSLPESPQIANELLFIIGAAAKNFFCLLKDKLAITNENFRQRSRYPLSKGDTLMIKAQRFAVEHYSLDPTPSD